MTSGEQTYVKRRANASPGFFDAEAAGLEWLRVPGGVSIVDVLAHDQSSITLAFVDTVAPTRRAAEEFGAALARTHDAGAKFFGAGPYDLGKPLRVGNADLPMPSAPPDSWGDFYADYRISPYVRKGRALGEFDNSDLEVFERLTSALKEGRWNDGAPPARLHGDLWAGNVLYDARGAVLIDPLAHGGHRITDLAMLDLFGIDYEETIFAAYERESSWLPDGWRRLIPLHQVHPLLVHTMLFGGGYAGAAVRAAQRALRV
ncbi:MAG: fructosamine kinase family protein [Propionibacteriaceae bacterium]|nr:fructosamine kinase family protein [Propionibacteriaceae bacterium]